MTQNKERLFIIDGMAQIYRAHFAMITNPLTTKDGKHTSVIYGFLNMLFKIIRDEKPDYLVIAMDSKSKTFRHDLFADYKANRQKMPDEISYQIPNLINTSFNVHEEPIVCSPNDAVRAYKESKIDYLFIGNYIVER